MASPRPQHWLFLGDFEEHCVREIFLGAAACAATRPGVTIQPWSTFPGRGAQPTAAELNKADGLLLADIERQILGTGAAARLRRPHVFFLPAEQIRGKPAVTLDHAAVGRVAALHLLERGYRELAFLGLPETPWSRTRAEGFRAAAAEHGVKVRSDDVLPTALQIMRPPRLHESHDAVLRALRGLPVPCGIFAACDIGACQVIQAARESGFRIPEQFGVLGTDNDPMSSAMAGLDISTVEIPFREGGHRAAALLHDLVRGNRPAAPPPVVPSRVIVRASTDAFMVADPLLRRALHLIEERRALGPSVGEIVTALRTTHVTLNQRFREHLQTTPSDYILRRRIVHAKELLRSGRLSVAEVAAACHFHKHSYFCQVFKTATGTNPRAWLPPHRPR